jgi:hypothetical protein
MPGTRQLIFLGFITKKESIWEVAQYAQILTIQAKSLLDKFTECSEIHSMSQNRSVSMEAKGNLFSIAILNNCFPSIVMIWYRIGDVELSRRIREYYMLDGIGI